ncbi:MAG: PHP domain-containing protein [Sandaracinaceae bacterium]|nr:PHP domain-containing protein [Sandaracinaceae bacterium]
MRLRLLLACLVLLPVAASAQIVLDGEVQDDGSSFLLLPFTVPDGTVEIEVRHDDLSAANILDWGLWDPNGFRGWGGGNGEPAIVGARASSRSYTAGPLPAGEWHVVVGKAQITERPARYHVEIDLRSTPTLAAQSERMPYAAAAALETGPRWYAGDFHVHSVESGDARPPIDEIATFARGRGLDFVLLSDHNTNSQVDFLAGAQARHPALLLIPGVEFTTYAGHANGIGVTRYVDHRLGVDGVTIEGALDALHAQGGLVSINHPVLDLGDLCIGCAWAHDVAADRIDAIEIATGGWRQSSFLFTPRAIDFWDARCATGRHLAAIGGSDDHRAGVDLGATGSPIGDPTTMVYASELSAGGIVDAVRAGRTVVRLQGPGDPMLELTANDAMVGDTVDAPQVTLRARVTGGAGTRLRFVHNGERLSAVPVASDPFETTLVVSAPYLASGPDRWRAELVEGRDLRVVTSHVWIAPQPGSPPDAGLDAGSMDGSTSGSMDASADASAEASPAGCGCRTTRGPLAPAQAFFALLVLLARRR